jgi:hypothetical protein
MSLFLLDYLTYQHTNKQIEYLRVCLEAVFLRGELLSPLFRTSKLRDESFGRFWVKFSGELSWLLRLFRFLGFIVAVDFI